MSEKMRVTMHNGRIGKDSVYSVKHNDRNFDTSETKHIKKEMSENNWTWNRYTGVKGGMTFEAAEKKYYEETFKVSLDAQNERHRKARNKDRVKTIDKYRAGRQTCPEETIYQIGKKEQTISAELLKQIALEQINWEIKTFPNVKILDAALHVDEEGAPHLHKRQVWIAQGKDGLTVSQNKALKEMGIERPDTSKEENRYNNAKMTYTERCRSHFLTVCKAHGLNIEVEPKEASKSGLTLLEYQRKQEQEKLKQIKEEQKKVAAAYQHEQEKLKQIKEEQKETATAYLKEATAKYNVWEEQKLESVRKAIKEANDKIKEASDKMKAANARVQEANNKVKSADSYVEKNIQKAKELQEYESDLQKKESDLQKKESDLQKKESDLQEKETRLQARESSVETKETDLQEKENNLRTEKKTFNKQKIKFSELEENAYFSMQKLKRDIKELTETELRARRERNNNDDFGQAVKELENFTNILNM